MPDKSQKLKQRISELEDENCGLKQKVAELEKVQVKKSEIYKF